MLFAAGAPGVTCASTLGDSVARPAPVRRGDGRVNACINIRLVAQWEVVLVAEVAAWFEALAEEDWDSAEQVEDAIDMLAVTGPTLGRPLVDRIKGPTVII
ncbi:hypothetical protein SHKM778_86640 [Streptomyces sp. KM77-8]|uniref:Uncharacterized protein n=1 Tax=Streptomyces haneummycinicus TaxID=3074435 RepID=A0AAT9HY08_9ACTN